MKIQTKILGTIITFSILPLLVQGLIFYSAYRKDLTRTVHSQLVSVAATQRSRLTAILRQNEERLALIASRTQLRINLDRFNATGDQASQDQMHRILVDAAASITDLVGIEVYGPAGRVAAATDPRQVGKPHFDPAFFEECRSTISVDHLHLDPEGNPRVYLSGPMFLDDRFIGVILIRSRVENLLMSIFDYSGLGETGETTLTRPLGGDRCRFLAPTRHAPRAAMSEMDWKTRPDPLDPGAETGWSPLTYTDYRGESVLAVSRNVPGTDWILTVKMDSAEALGELGKPPGRS